MLNPLSSNTKKEQHKPWNAPKYIQTKQDNRKLVAYQQAVLLALLNKYCSFYNKKPTKQTHVSVVMPKVVTLHIEEEDLFIGHITDSICKTMYNNEINNGINESTAMRRYEKNRKVFIQNLIFDIALEFGYLFGSTLSRKSGRTLRLERIDSVYYEGKLLLNKKEIIQQGAEINGFLCQFFGSSDTFKVEKNNSVLQHFLHKNSLL
ncbi:TATA-binding protein-associated phosphoprotein [Entamoeba marina]